MKWRSFVLVLSLAAAGCSTNAPDGAGSTTQPTLAVPSTAKVESAALPNSDAFDTTLSPSAATTEIAGVYGELRLDGVDRRGKFYSPGGNVVGSYPVESDYFCGEAMAQTALGEQIDVTCRWVRDGETRVLVKSNLPPAQHARLVEMLRSAMAAAATQRATFKKSE